MENVTDTVFRRIVIECGAPHVFFTEFTRVEQVAAYPRRGLPGRMRAAPGERPLVVQIWGTDPELYARAATIVAELGYDGIDINMGCPVRKIRNKGSCSGLIINPTLAAEIIAATREGTRTCSAAGLPVSVKTRIGFDRPIIDEWIGFLLQQDIDLLTVHGRTAFQESEGAVDYAAIARAVTLRDAHAPRTLVLANGDIDGIAAAYRAHRTLGVDGVMIGRAIFNDPFLFSRLNGYPRRFADQSPLQKIELMKRHIKLHRRTWNGYRNYEVLKRFYKIYLVGFDGAQQLRDRLNRTSDYEGALREIADFTRCAR
ncbi:MAG: tRNA-dihydrouridine synthase [Spirochaetaceae bacterium]|nr:MAG: tRNA-dihydrouridine synthase [Spirochaetaceae bacterium]